MVLTVFPVPGITDDLQWGLKIFIQRKYYRIPWVTVALHHNFFFFYSYLCPLGVLSICITSVSLLTTFPLFASVWLMSCFMGIVVSLMKVFSDVVINCPEVLTVLVPFLNSFIYSRVSSWLWFICCWCLSVFFAIVPTQFLLWSLALSQDLPFVPARLFFPLSSWDSFVSIIRPSPSSLYNLVLNPSKYYVRIKNFLLFTRCSFSVLTLTPFFLLSIVGYQAI